jgi:hypothetical protein
MGKVRLPGIRKENGSTALIEPVDLLLAEEEDAAYNEFGNPLGVRLGIGQSKRRTPGSSEYLPSLNAQMLADLLDIADQIPGRVRFKRCVRGALTAATLIEVDDAVFFRVPPGPPCRKTTGLPEELPLCSK